jgi:hypothetical protein
MRDPSVRAPAHGCLARSRGSCRESATPGWGAWPTAARGGTGRPTPGRMSPPLMGPGDWGRWLTVRFGTAPVGHWVRFGAPRPAGLCCQLGSWGSCGRCSSRRRTRTRTSQTRTRFESLIRPHQTRSADEGYCQVSDKPRRSRRRAFGPVPCGCRREPSELAIGAESDTTESRANRVETAPGERFGIATAGRA